MELYIGIALAILGGGLQGAFVLPMKFMKKWEWENGWLVFVLVCCVIFPLGFAFAFTPDLLGILKSQDAKTLHAVFWFGAGWGIGNILFGLGAKFLGMALGIALITGINCVLGTIFPILFLDPGKFTIQAGIVLGLGLIVMIFGVIIVSSAGAIRDKELKTGQVVEADKSNVPFIVGLIVCVAAGIFCPMMNFSVHFGKPITQAVEALGTVSGANTGYALLVPALIGGSLAQIVYCIYLFNKNKSFKNYFIQGTGSNHLKAVAMACFWFFGMALYAVATGIYIRDVGNIVGWPLFLSATIIVSNILGVLTREWKGVSKKAFMMMYGGIVLLILAIVLASLSNKYLPTDSA
ncbi:MAG: L-rhamnose/proton symporter RhaT [Planctomycetota bacterium]|jgi:L-rhamnose-H+ transport protein